jgi:iron complex transport system ATP-binding protein
VSVDNREFVGIIGPNGSGKSTLLKTIYRTLKPNAGVVKLDGVPLQKISLKESARKLGVLTQMSTFSFDFSVLETTMMGRTPHKKALESDNDADYQIAWEALERVGMQQYADRKINTLSGGERQRVLMARALTAQPKALILDEPTNHLDIQYQISLLELVKSLGVEVFAAMHDLNLAATYCDYLYVMQHGKVAASGSPSEVLTVDLLREIFKVKADIQVLDSGRLNIIYTGL